MIGDYSTRAAERAWKHRFAQTLYEAFCSGGQDRDSALADAYAHADAQYHVRGLETPEAEARTALTWILTDAVPATVHGAGKSHRATPHHGRTSQAIFLGPDLSE